MFSVNTEKFLGRGQGHWLRAHEVDSGGKFEKVRGTDFELDADLVLLAMGFVGPERPGADRSRRGLTDRGNVARGDDFGPRCRGVRAATWAAGSPLIVWAIAEGGPPPPASTAYLMGTPRCRDRSNRQPPRSLDHSPVGGR